MSDDISVTKTGSYKGAEAVKEERQLRALRLRTQGFSYREIGHALKVSHAQAFRDVQCMIKELHEECKEEAVKVRTLQLERINAVLASIWPRAINENGKYKAAAQDAAIDRFTRIEDQRARLMGTYAPTKTESKVQHSLDELLDQVEEDEVDQETETDPTPEEVA